MHATLVAALGPVRFHKQAGRNRASLVATVGLFDADGIYKTRHIVMMLEAGKCFPSLLPAFRIARVFGAHVEQVFEHHAIELHT